MKKSLSFIVFGAVMLSAQAAFAVCNGSSDCERPASNGSQAAWTASASGMSAIQTSNSIGPSGNDAGSRYYFAATTANLGATTAKGTISTTGDGAGVIGTFALNSGSTPGSTVTGGSVSQLLGAQTYFFYAQACPSGAAIDSARCSVWSQIGTRNTSPYPTDVFSTPVRPSHTTTDSIFALTTVPAADINFISQLEFRVDDLINGLSQSNIILAWPLTNQANEIDSEYTAGGGFRPNTKYQFRGQVYYPYGVGVPTAGAEVETNLWTTPVNPSNVTVSNITHCSADITSRNSAGAPANPTYTVYQLCADPTSPGSDTCVSDVIGGTGIPTNTITRTITGLVPGTTYTPQAVALVGNGDGSQVGWNSSGEVSGGDFTTDGTGGVFTVTNITTTSADFNFPPGFDVTGAVSWQRIIDGVLTGPVVAGLPPATIAFTGLTPNTAYTIQVRVNEASCNYVVPPVGLTFTTTPNVPQTFALTANSARQLGATWSANSNPGTTVYQIQYCLDAGFTTGCVNAPNTAAGATSATINGVNPQTTYFAHVRALTVGGGLDSAFSNSSSATTPNEAPAVDTASCSAPGGSPTTSTCGGTTTDNGAVGELRCSWSMQSGPGAVTFNPATPQTATGGSYPAACPNVTATYPTNGSYVLVLTVTDANGTGLTDTRTVSVNVGQSASTIIVSPSTATVATGNTRNFTATVYDQFGAVLPGQSVDWNVSGGGNVSPGTGASTTFTATTPGSGFVLTASLAGSGNGTATINVVAAGPFIVTSPTLVMNPNQITGALSTLGNDNVAGEASLSYTWSLESGPAPVVVNPNGNNAAKNATASFSRAGAYVMRVTISNSNGSVTDVTSTVNIAQVPSGMVVCPAGSASPCATSVTLKTLQDQQFEARIVDQFGLAMNTPPNVTWSTTGGNINASGVFNANQVGINVTITAQSGSLQGAINVTLVSFDVSNAKAYPVPWKASQGRATITFDNLGSNASIHIYTTSGRLVFETRVSNPTYDWDVKNMSGESIASGVYFYVIESPEGKKNGKLIIIK